MEFKTINIEDVQTSKFQDEVKKTFSKIPESNSYKLPRPSFRYSTSTTIKVPGAPTYPIRALLNGQIYQVEEDLYCNLSLSGPGGLRAGLTVTSNTVYYFYLVLHQDKVMVMADTVAPTQGPLNVQHWTYLGAVCTPSGGSSLTPFVSSDGFCVFDNQVNVVSHTGGLTPQVKTLSNLPLTSKQAWGFIIIGGPTTNTAGRVMGTNTSNNNALYQLNINATTNNTNYGFVPIFTGQTIYLQLEASGNTVFFYYMGFRESPMEYQ